jgi:hypothetical protein
MAHYPAVVLKDPHFNSTDFGNKLSTATGAAVSTLNFGAFALNAASILASGAVTAGSVTASSLNATSATKGLTLAAPGSVNTGPIQQASYSWGLIAEGQVSTSAVASTFFTFPATPTGVYFYQLCVKVLGQDAASLYYLSCDPSSATKYSAAVVLNYGTTYPTVTFLANALQVTTATPQTIQWSVMQV